MLDPKFVHKNFLQANFKPSRASFKSYYARLPKSIKEEELSVLSKLVLHDIVKVARVEKNCSRMDNYFAIRHDVSKGLIKGSLRELEKKNFIRVVQIEKAHSWAFRSLKLTKREKYKHLIKPYNI